MRPFVEREDGFLYEQIATVISDMVANETLAPGDAFLDDLQLAVKAPSLGGPETLTTRPAFSSHADLSPEEREAAGITEGLFRISTGLEEVTAIRRDIEQALSRAHVQMA